MFTIKGKNAIITGAYEGLGYGIAEEYAKQGANLVLLDINQRVEKVAQELEQYQIKALGICCDLADRKKREQAFLKALNFFEGKLDVLINNAGLQIRHPALAYPINDWDKLIEVNLTAVFDLCQKAGNVMAKQGQGKIINIASVNSFVGGINTSAYVSSKGGVAQLTKGLSNEWAAKGINVNAIAPGYMDTPLNVNLVEDKQRFERLTQRIPIGRWGTPKDIVGTAIFLASDAASYISGIVMPVDGGFLGR